MTGPSDHVETTDATAHETCGCKVGRLLEAYELESMKDELAFDWTREDGEDSSVRALTDRFNERILRAEMQSAGMEFLDGEVSTIYDHLVGDEVNRGQETQVRNRLSRHGIDVAALEDRFVSHQSIYRHLHDCLGLDKDRTPTVDRERDRIHRLQNRSEVVVADSVSRLRANDQLAAGAFDVLVNFRVMCEECNSLYDVSEFLDDGGCDCQK